MMPKRNKTTKDQLRPIALTDNSNKFFMGLTKDKIEEHLLRNDQLNKMQAGFTLKRRIEDNLIMLNECKEVAFKSNKKNNCN